MSTKLIRNLPGLILWTALFSAAVPAIAQEYPRVGAKAKLATFFHQVSGTATITSSNSIRVEDFNYDGGGPAVYFYLGTNRTATAFHDGIYFTNLLTGTAYSNATVEVTLPGDMTLDGFNALSVWCAAVSVDFGSGTFQPHLQSVRRTNGTTLLSASGAAGEVYELQVATNAALSGWDPLATKTNITGTVTFSDTNSSESGFYRIGVQ